MPHESLILNMTRPFVLGTPKMVGPALNADPFVFGKAFHEDLPLYLLNSNEVSL